MPSVDRLVLGASLGAAAAAALLLLRRRRAAPATSHNNEQESVLRFWFDGDLDSLYTTRWFVQVGSQAQTALDAEVVERFGALLQRAEAGELDHWADESPRAAVALTVLLDQISRHVHRAERRLIEANDARALPVCEALLARGWDTALPTAELVFALMPLRHQPTEARLQEVMARSRPRLARSEEDGRLLAKFMRATNLRLQHLQGQGDPDDILEREDTEHACDQSAAADCELGRTVHGFLLEQGLVRGGGGDESVHGGARQGEREGGRRAGRQGGSGGCGGDGGGGSGGGGTAGAGAAPPADSATLVVSLSGGVDSMVLLHLLLALRRRHGYSYRLVAVHLDYANRTESAAEAAYVRGWCEARQVTFRVRRVDEVTRGVTARDAYEKESRRIRFEAYAAALAELGGEGVFFGHHRGDVHENVLSNVMKGANLLNVAGIAPASIVSTVLIYRPMLHHPKEDIYAYSHRFGVPYFKDSTPTWSTRGKLRNQLMPLLHEVYGEGIGAHLSGIAKDSVQCAALVESQLLAPLWASAVRSRAAVWLELADYAAMPIFFWREALRHVCEKMLGTGLVREKPLLLLMERLGREPSRRRDGWLALKRDNRALLVGTTLVLFDIGLFRGHHEGRVWMAEPHAAEGEELRAPSSGAPSVARLGAWVVTLSMAAGRGDESEEPPPRPAAAGNGGGGGGGAPPAVLWSIAAGRVRYVLPGRTAYAVGCVSTAQAPPMLSLRGELWAPLLGAVPQVVEAGAPSDSGDVLVELEYAPPSRPDQRT